VTKLYEIHSTFTRFTLRNEGLRARKLLGYFKLRQPRIFARLF
jgi:hypothetical protein